MGYSPWGHRELDTTEHVAQMQVFCIHRVSFDPVSTQSKVTLL